jgi:hypothetical protein
MIKRQQRIQWIRAVASEHLPTRSAANLLIGKLRADPNYGRNQAWQARDGAAFNANLESAYIIRLYAEFEAGLRDYWANCRKKTTNPPMAQLLQSLASQRISIDHLEDADAVRAYRDFLVHSESGELPPDMRAFTVAESNAHLCYFFGRLDPDW